ncbi:MAG: hypothetical protein MJ211_16160 [Bacteroidales bacterium]|nr:hypothetical protein [Bacteroidales bacterium]
MNQLAKVTQIAIRQNACPALKLSNTEFLVEMAPRIVTIAQRNCNSVSLAIVSDLPSLVDVKCVYGVEYAIGYIKLWIQNLCEYLGDKFTMTKAQIDETANLIYADNYFLNIADVNIVFSRIKKGDINMFGGLNGAKLCSLFSEYRAERANVAYEQSHNSDEIIKKHGFDCSSTLTEEQVYEMYKNAREKRDAEEAEKTRLAQIGASLTKIQVENGK